MPDWDRIDPKLHEWTAERINPGEMCRRLGWDRKKRQTIVDRLRKLGLKEPAQSQPKQGEPMSDETTEAPEVLPGHMSRETTDTPPHDPVSTIVDIVPVNGEISAPLSLNEAQTLKQYEQIIDQGIQIFVEVGRALLAIRDQRLYRESYQTFEAYCRERWDLSRPRAYQLIDAAQARDVVSTIVDIVPVNEAQARPLTSLPPEQQREVWREVVKTAPPSGITAKHVQAIVNRAKGKTTSPRASKPTPQEPEPRRPARHKVQEGLAWCLSEVKDDDAWEVLEWLWDTLNGLAPTYPTFRGVLDRIEPRFPDEHRPLRGLAYEREHADEEPATE
jgi:hypothetical protein